MEFQISKKPKISGDSKYTKNCLTLEEKMKVIERAEQGEGYRYLAKVFNCGRTQISSIIKNKARFQDEWENGTMYAKPRRCQYSDLNRRVWDWVCDSRSKNIALTWKAIQEQAIIFSTEMKDCDSFTASNGWLESFKQRYLKQYGPLDSSSCNVPTACVVCGYTASNKALIGPFGNATPEYSLALRFFGPDLDLGLKDSSICAVCDKNLKHLVEIETEMQNLEQRLWERIQTKTSEGSVRFDKMYPRFLQKRSKILCDQLTVYGKEGYFVYIDKNSLDIMCTATPHAQKFLTQNSDELRRFMSSFRAGESVSNRTGVVSESPATDSNFQSSPVMENSEVVNNILPIPDQFQPIPRVMQSVQGLIQPNSQQIQTTEPKRVMNLQLDNSSLHDRLKLPVLSSMPQLKSAHLQSFPCTSNSSLTQKDASNMGEVLSSRNMEDGASYTGQNLRKNTVKAPALKKVGKGKRKIKDCDTSSKMKPTSLTIEPLLPQGCLHPGPDSMLVSETDMAFEKPTAQSPGKEEEKTDSENMVHAVCTDIQHHEKVHLETRSEIKEDCDVVMQLPVSEANVAQNDDPRKMETIAVDPDAEKSHCLTNVLHFSESGLHSGSDTVADTEALGTNITIKKNVTVPCDLDPNPVPIMLVGNFHASMQKNSL